MAIIVLSNGKTAFIDDEDITKVEGLTWYEGSVGYAYHSIYMGRKDGKELPSKKVALHRVIMDAKPGEVVDHISGDKLDNRKQNLRLCTISENGMNRGAASHNRTGYKGVCSHPNGRWSAKIVKRGKRLWLGYFPSALEAASAYNEAATKIHGEFAKLNPL